ncbi:hypothetical protein IE984_28035 [Klebsiella pneumoniae]|nr:hypothetical protein [Klebsiella pneumoniae]
MTMPFYRISPVYLLHRQRRRGKTSLACATAVWLADQGRRTLLVSTDPASMSVRSSARLWATGSLVSAPWKTLRQWKLTRWRPRRLTAIACSILFVN